MDIAQRIKKARLAKGMSQRTLAHKVGVTPAAVGQWETSVTRPSIVNRVDICRVLGIEIHEILPEAEGINPILFKDPDLIQLLRQFSELSPTMRAIALMQVEILHQSQKRNPPKPPSGR